MVKIKNKYLYFVFRNLLSSISPRASSSRTKRRVSNGEKISVPAHLRNADHDTETSISPALNSTFSIMRFL